MTAPLTGAGVSGARKNDRIGTQLVAETDGMRIWHLRIAPGKTLPAHRHDRPYFWTILCDGKARSRFDDGRVVDVTYSAGQTQHFPDLTPSDTFVHDLTNTGDQDLVFVTVEFEHKQETP